MVLVYVAFAVTIVEYLFIPLRLRTLAPELMQSLAPAWYLRDAAAGLPVDARGPWWGVLVPQLWWVTGTLLLWFVVPLVVASRAGMPPRRLGLSTAGLAGSRRFYVALFLALLPAIAWAGTQPGFLAIYPLLRPNYAPAWCWAVLLIFWCLYALQFLAVEFFFRGFIVLTLERSMGAAAIAVSAVPYCMIHFHKPMAEALGAIGAGLILGWLALRTRSIWGGVVLHVAVALTMDVIALARSGAFPTRFWP